MNEEASAGEEDIQGPPPYDSERMPSRPDSRFSNYDTVSWGRGEE